MVLCRDYPSEPLFRRLPHDLGADIVEGLPADSLLRLRGTCALADAYVSIAFQRRLHRVLQDFVEDIDGLLRLLDDHNAGLTGRASLTFLFPEHALGPVLDIAVPQDSLHDVREYLSSWEGYEVEDPLNIKQLSCVWDNAWMKCGDKEIRVQESTHSTSLLLACAQWNTALYNFVRLRARVYSRCDTYSSMSKSWSKGLASQTPN